MNTEPNNEQPSEEDLFASLIDDGATPPAEPALEAPAEPVEPAEPPAPAEPALVPAVAAAPVSEPVVADPLAQPAAAVPEWVQALPAEARQAWDAMQGEHQRLQSDLSRERQNRQAVEGRLAPMQRKLAAFERSDFPGAAATATPAQGVPAPQANQPLDSYFDSASWKKFEAEFPEEAATQRAALEWVSKDTDARIKALEERVTRQVNDPRITEVIHHADELRLSREITSLEGRHSDWREINESPEFIAWINDWRQRQPKEVRSIYMDEGRFRQMCSDSEFAGNLLDEFKRDAVLAEIYSTPAPAATTPTPAPRQTSALLELTAAPELRGGAAPRPIDQSQMPTEDLFAALWNAPPPQSR